MISSKQRSFLRGLANPIKATLQLGKEGLTEEFVRQYDEMIEPRELVKINVLESNGLDVREVAHELAERTSSEVVQVIGHKVTLYRASTLDPKIDIVHFKVVDSKSAEQAKKKIPSQFPKLGRQTGPHSKVVRHAAKTAQHANSEAFKATKGGAQTKRGGSHSNRSK